MAPPLLRFPAAVKFAGVLALFFSVSFFLATNAGVNVVKKQNQQQESNRIANADPFLNAGNLVNQISSEEDSNFGFVRHKRKRVSKGKGAIDKVPQQQVLLPLQQRPQLLALRRRGKGERSRRRRAGSSGWSSRPFLQATQFQLEMLQEHNWARQSVGLEPLQWSWELVSFAQKPGREYERCSGNGSSDEERQKVFSFANVGENLFVVNEQSTPSARQIMTSWIGEGVCYAYGPYGHPCTSICTPVIAAGGQQQQQIAGNSHFTQLLWASATHVGCAVQACLGCVSAEFCPGHYVVCNYGSAGMNSGGNVMGIVPFDSSVAVRLSVPFCKLPFAELLHMQGMQTFSGATIGGIVAAPPSLANNMGRITSSRIKQFVQQYALAKRHLMSFAAAAANFPAAQHITSTLIDYASLSEKLLTTLMSSSAQKQKQRQRNFVERRKPQLLKVGRRINAKLLLPRTVATDALQFAISLNNLALQAVSDFVAGANIALPVDDLEFYRQAIQSVSSAMQRSVVGGAIIHSAPAAAAAAAAAVSTASDMPMYDDEGAKLANTGDAIQRTEHDCLRDIVKEYDDIYNQLLTNNTRMLTFYDPQMASLPAKICDTLNGIRLFCDIYNDTIEALASPDIDQTELSDINDVVGDTAASVVAVYVSLVSNTTMYDDIAYQLLRNYVHLRLLMEISAFVLDVCVNSTLATRSAAASPDSAVWLHPSFLRCGNEYDCMTHELHRYTDYLQDLSDDNAVVGNMYNRTQSLPSEVYDSLVAFDKFHSVISTVVAAADDAEKKGNITIDLFHSLNYQIHRINTEAIQLHEAIEPWRSAYVDLADQLLENYATTFILIGLNRYAEPYCASLSLVTGSDPPIDATSTSDVDDGGLTLLNQALCQSKTLAAINDKLVLKYSNAPTVPLPKQIKVAVRFLNSTVELFNQVISLTSFSAQSSSSNATSYSALLSQVFDKVQTVWGGAIVTLSSMPVLVNQVVLYADAVSTIMLNYLVSANLCVDIMQHFGAVTSSQPAGFQAMLMLSELNLTSRYGSTSSTSAISSSSGIATTTISTGGGYASKKDMFRSSSKDDGSEDDPTSGDVQRVLTDIRYNCQVLTAENSKLLNYYDSTALPAALALPKKVKNFLSFSTLSYNEIISFTYSSVNGNLQASNIVLSELFGMLQEIWQGANEALTAIPEEQGVQYKDCIATLALNSKIPKQLWFELLRILANHVENANPVFFASSTLSNGGRSSSGSSLGFNDRGSSSSSSSSSRGNTAIIGAWERKQQLLLNFNNHRADFGGNWVANDMILIAADGGGDIEADKADVQNALCASLCLCRVVAVENINLVSKYQNYTSGSSNSSSSSTTVAPTPLPETVATALAFLKQTADSYYEVVMLAKIIPNTPLVKQLLLFSIQNALQKVCDEGSQTLTDFTMMLEGVNDQRYLDVFVWFNANIVAAAELNAEILRLFSSDHRQYFPAVGTTTATVRATAVASRRAANDVAMNSVDNYNALLLLQSIGDRCSSTASSTKLLIKPYLAPDELPPYDPALKAIQFVESFWMMCDQILDFQNEDVSITIDVVNSVFLSDLADYIYQYTDKANQTLSSLISDPDMSKYPMIMIAVDSVFWCSQIMSFQAKIGVLPPLPSQMLSTFYSTHSSFEETSDDASSFEATSRTPRHAVMFRVANVFSKIYKQVMPIISKYLDPAEYGNNSKQLANPVKFASLVSGMSVVVQFYWTQVPKNSKFVSCQFISQLGLVLNVIYLNGIEILTADDAPQTSQYPDLVNALTSIVLKIKKLSEEIDFVFKSPLSDCGPAVAGRPTATMMEAQSRVSRAAVEFAKNDGVSTTAATTSVVGSCSIVDVLNSTIGGCTALVQNNEVVVNAYRRKADQLPEVVLQVLSFLLYLSEQYDKIISNLVSYLYVFQTITPVAFFVPHYNFELIALTVDEALVFIKENNGQEMMQQNYPDVLVALQNNVEGLEHMLVNTLSALHPPSANHVMGSRFLGSSRGGGGRGAPGEGGWLRGLSVNCTPNILPNITAYVQRIMESISSVIRRRATDDSLSRQVEDALVWLDYCKFVFQSKLSALLSELDLSKPIPTEVVKTVTSWIDLLRTGGELVVESFSASTKSGYSDIFSMIDQINEAAQCILEDIINRAVEKGGDENSNNRDDAYNSGDYGDDEDHDDTFAARRKSGATTNAPSRHRRRPLKFSGVVKRDTVASACTNPKFLLVKAVALIEMLADECNSVVSSYDDSYAGATTKPDAVKKAIHLLKVSVDKTYPSVTRVARMAMQRNYLTLNSSLFANIVSPLQTLRSELTPLASALDNEEENMQLYANVARAIKMNIVTVNKIIDSIRSAQLKLEFSEQLLHENSVSSKKSIGTNVPATTTEM